MRETMGQIIKRLRKDRNLTQEELAEQLNISSQAVSKWENDSSMPDISQVVPLSNLFGVPTDVLFGVHGKDNEEDVKQRLEEIFRMYDNCKDGEEAETAIAILEKYREAAQLYPTNTTILINAMAFAQMVITYNENELKEIIGQEGVDGIVQELIRRAEIVIRYGTSIDDVLAAKGNLIDIRVRQKNWEEAYAIADGLPHDIRETRGIRMADLKYNAGKTEEERKLRCRNIEELADQLGHQVIMLGNLYMRQGQYEDALYCYSFMQDMLDSMYREEEYRPPFVYLEYPLFHSPAVCLVKLGRNEEAVALLEKGVRFVIAQAKYYNKKRELNVPLFKDRSFGYGFDGNAEYRNVADKLKMLIGGDDLAPLAGEASYRALVARIDEIEGEF